MSELPIFGNDDKCNGCGACCMGMGVPPLGDDAEDDAWWDSLPEHLQEEINAVTNIIGPCVWLDLETRKCKHYDIRPATCRHFEPGCDLCLEDRASRGIE